ncbi:hypothetical protein [Kribbella speibonae]|uniref:DUF3592 domain-containing protein n=1 Tax=Kribbella speibonae TaxID=1572660 RepID=A0ABY1ZUT6_9ACTN|nr:hypothetical protein [Kribbella speibonae]TCC18055.1 hypothetical protein E0H58_35100 [Kribbella speibonae]
MRRIRGALSWVFVRGPAAAYELADSGSSLFGIGAVVAMGLVGGLGAGVGALVGVLAHRSVGDAAFVGGMVGLGVVMAWLVLMVVVAGVLWVRRGGRQVPLSLVSFFALMAVIFGGLGLAARSASQPADEPTAVTNGTVVAIHEPGLLDKGSGSVDIRYTVGGVDHTFETDRDPGDHFLRLGDVVPVEYVVADPSKGRAIWEVEAAGEDKAGWLWIAGICAVLGLLSGAGYLVGRWRSSGRRGG